MNRVRFQAPDAAGARQAAEAALSSRSGPEPRWSLGLLRTLTPECPGTHAYVVTFAAWEACGERFVRRDVYRREVWATDGTAARRQAVEEVQAVPDYLPAWRVTGVARRRAPGDPAHVVGEEASVAALRRPGRPPPHYARRPGTMR